MPGRIPWERMSGEEIETIVCHIRMSYKAECTAF